MEGRYFPALPGRDDTYTDDYKGNSSNSSPQRSLHAPKHSHKPQPPLGRGVETGVSPKRERLVQHLPEQQRYIGGGGAGSGVSGGGELGGKRGEGGGAAGTWPGAAGGCNGDGGEPGG